MDADVPVFLACLLSLPAHSVHPRPPGTHTHAYTLTHAHACCLQDEVQHEETTANAKFLFVDCGPLKQMLTAHCQLWKSKLTNLLNNLAATELNSLHDYFRCVCVWCLRICLRTQRRQSSWPHMHQHMLPVLCCIFVVPDLCWLLPAPKRSIHACTAAFSPQMPPPAHNTAHRLRHLPGRRQTWTSCLQPWPSTSGWWMSRRARVRALSR